MSYLIQQYSVSLEGHHRKLLRSMRGIEASDLYSAMTAQNSVLPPTNMIFARCPM